MQSHDPQANENENHLIGNILAEDNSGNSQWIKKNVDSENEDPKANRISFAAGFGIGQNSLYGGAFSNVPERVGSAPATDFSVVSFSPGGLADCYRSFRISEQRVLRARSMRFLSSLCYRLQNTPSPLTSWTQWSPTTWVTISTEALALISQALELLRTCNCNSSS